MIRISIGLASITLSILFAAHALGLLPDPEVAVVQGRKALCEAEAVHCALAVQQGDLAPIRAALLAQLPRNPDVLSAAIRTADGRLVVEAGDHHTHWEDEGGSFSTATHVQAPVTVNGLKWGSVEMRFQGAAHSRLWTFLTSPVLLLGLFTGAASFLFTFLYLRTVLRHADRDHAKVMPERVRSTLNTVAEGVLVLDRKHRIVLANEAFAEKVGRGPDQLTGRSVFDLPWQPLEGVQEADAYPWVRSLAQGTTEMGTVLGLRSDRAGLLKLSVNTTPIVSDDGSCRGSLATFDDLTPVETKNAQLVKLLHRLHRSRGKIRRQKKDLEVARDAAEAASRAKSEFLANVSHEIRTPMNAILGMTEAALETHLGVEQREYLGIVHDAAESLLKIINDLLDFSKIEAGKLTLETIAFDLPANLADSLKLLTFRAQSKGLKLACEVQPGVPRFVVGDPVRLRQILINLMGNALKFTEQGEVVVGVAAEEPHAKTQRRKEEEGSSPSSLGGLASLREVLLHFSVRDTGIGIPANKLDSIFAPFVQADGSTTRKYGGTGLGLSICRHLVELMGGRIWVESEEGKGSIFHFTAQFALADAAAETTRVPDNTPAHLPRPRNHLHILLVDDNSFNQKVATVKLEKEGHQVTVAGGGREALALLDQQPFDLVLMDMQMPDMDGLEATRLIRCTEEGTGRHIPVLAMTAHARAEVRDRCLAGGMDGYIAKPIRDQELWQAIAAVCPAGPDDSTEPSSPRTPVLDQASALDRVGGDVDLLRQLADVFRDDCARLVPQLQAALQEGDAGQLREAAHTLKGMVGFFSAPTATEAAVQLEQFGQKGELAGAEQALATLVGEIERVQEVLTAVCSR